MFVSKKKFQELEKTVAGINDDLSGFIDHVNTNGVATAINKLNEEVLGDVKVVKDIFPKDSILAYHWATREEPSLKSKVDAIVEHLKLEFKIHPAQSKKVKVTKKAGK